MWLKRYQIIFAVGFLISWNSVDAKPVKDEVQSDGCDCNDILDMGKQVCTNEHPNTNSTEYKECLSAACGVYSICKKQSPEEAKCKNMLKGWCAKYYPPMK